MEEAAQVMLGAIHAHDEAMRIARAAVQRSTTEPNTDSDNEEEDNTNMEES